jgi:hypothetical protein
MAKFKYTLLAGATAICAPMLGLIPAGANDSVIKGGQNPNQWAVLAWSGGSDRESSCGGGHPQAAGSQQGAGDCGGRSP